MRAVWQVAQRAVRRRRLQTFVIGLVVLFSTASIVVSLALLAALSAPFDKAFEATRGAQAVAGFDLSKVSMQQLAATGGSGPFATVTLTIPSGVRVPGLRPGPIAVAGRAGPGGPVDELDLWHGRWPAADGEIVLNMMPPAVAGEEPFDLAGSFTAAGGRKFTIVGLAYSLSQSARGWVTPAQAAALHPASAQVLYRWSGGGLDTQAGLDAHLAEATKGLPAGSLEGSRSYLALRAAAASGPGRYLPFLAIFGVLGLAVAILIVANVVSGAVVSGYRHIGVLKSLGFAPRQVVAVYLLMAGVPAVAGVIPGAALGYPLAAGMLHSAFEGAGLGTVTVAVWPVAAAVAGMIGIVLLAALVPAVRAGRLSTTEAISAGSATRRGRAVRAQRRLTGSRLPRAVSLGLGLPLTRPGRTALTGAAVLLGVTTVAFASGVAASLGRFADARDNSEYVQVVVLPGMVQFGDRAPAGDPARTEAALAALPGAASVTTVSPVSVAIAGNDTPVNLQYLHGDYADLGYQDQLISGRWLAGPGETVVTSAFLRDRGARLGDRVTLLSGQARTTVTVVGEMIGDDPDEAYADWATQLRLDPRTPLGGELPEYLVRLKPGTGADAYANAVTAADPGLHAMPNTEDVNSFIVTVDGIALVLTVMLAIVAALGVFQTVVLNTRERQRDLAMLKAIGMTPRQVVTMMVTSMAGLGLLGGVLGLGLGVAAHEVSVPLVAAAAGTDIPATMLSVWRWSLVAGLLLAGLAIAVAGSYLPARAAGRLSVAEALRNE